MEAGGMVEAGGITPGADQRGIGGAGGAGITRTKTAINHVSFFRTGRAAIWRAGAWYLCEN